MSDRLTLDLPEELVEMIARRAADLVRMELAAERKPQRRWLTCREAGERLGCSAAAVRMRYRRRRLRGKYQGRRLYIDARSVEELE
jgi:hypothetical protein